MLCNTCLQIFSGESLPHDGSDTVHHASYESLQESAEDGCQICFSLWEAWKDIEQNDELFDTYNLSLEKEVAGVFQHTILSGLISFNLKRKNGEAMQRPSPMFVLDLQSYLDPLVGSHYAADCTDSEANAKLVQWWIDKCCEKHSECKSNNPNNWRPSRLLDLGPADEEAIPRLIVTQDQPFRIEDRYNTLSHCWGSTKFVTLLQENFNDMLASIPDNALSKTFKDTIYLTREMGVRYLWIDSLCIIQDSTDDWLQEAAVMGEIYKYSFCTIAASGARDGTEGCFFKRNPACIRPSTVSIQWAGLPAMSYYVTSFADVWTETYRRTPLSRRAWAFQERLLASRVVHFGREQLLWECRCCSASETYPHGLRDSFRGNSFSRSKQLLHQALSEPETKSLASFWSDSVCLYSVGALTFKRDRLLALGGVVREIQRSESGFGGEYLAGIWRNDLPNGLLWFAEDGKQADGQPSFRPHEHRAPTWSWVSVEGVISLGPEYIAQQGSVHATVIEAQVVTVNEDTAGQVKGGFIRIRGPFTSATWEKDSGSGVVSITKIKDRSGADIPVPQQSSDRGIFFDDSVTSDNPAEIFCLIISTASLKWFDFEPYPTTLGLVLELCEDGNFKRLGFMMISGAQTKLFEDLPERTVTII